MLAFEICHVLVVKPHPGRITAFEHGTPHSVPVLGMVLLSHTIFGVFDLFCFVCAQGAAVPAPAAILPGSGAVAMNGS